MYFGSVRFFRHIIVGTVLAVIAISISLNIYYVINISAQKKEMTHIADELASLKSPPPQNATDLPLNLDNPNSASDASSPENDATLLPYQTLYEDMYCETPVPVKSPEKTVYLTFDDGPSKYTQKVLDVLDAHNIKATFFVVGSKIVGNEKLLKAISDAGHTVGIHTYSHEYTAIYKSVDAYLADFSKAYTLVYEITGVRPTTFRFPGGSINSYNQPVYQQIISEMLRRGFVYYDWNVSAGDASSKSTVASVKSSILDYVGRFSSSIVLLHDSRDVTTTALDSVITALETQAYRFDKITPSVPPIAFGYKN